MENIRWYRHREVVRRSRISFLLLWGVEKFNFYSVFIIITIWAGDNFLLSGLHIPACAFGMSFTKDWSLKRECLNISKLNMKSVCLSELLLCITFPCYCVLMRPLYRATEMTLLTKIVARLGPESADGYCSHIKALSCSAFQEKKVCFLMLTVMQYALSVFTMSNHSKLMAQMLA